MNTPLRKFLSSKTNPTLLVSPVNTHKNKQLWLSNTLYQPCLKHLLNIFPTKRHGHPPEIGPVARVPGWLLSYAMLCCAVPLAVSVQAGIPTVLVTWRPSRFIVL